MQINGPSHVHGAQPINGPHNTRSARPTQNTQPANKIGDQLDISEAAQLASEASEVTDVRADLVARVRNEIANGTYETQAKLDAALDRMLDEIG